jgi:hypothetical protein
MENLSFTAGLERALAWIQAHDGMWPAVAFRLLAITVEQGAPPTVRTWVAHFQTSTTPQPSRSKVRLQAPLVLEGVIGISEFKDWLLNWSDGRATSIDGWDLPPPAGITFMSFDKDVTVAPDYYPLIEELPAFATPYREVRLSGSGEQISQDTRYWLQERLFDLSASRAEMGMFSREYLGTRWGGDASYVMIHLPLAVGMNASYLVDVQELQIEVHFRPPLTPADFEVRIGSGFYDASLPAETPLLAERDEFGWDVATVTTPRQPGGTAKVWLKRHGMVADFGWELTVDLGRQPTPELRRERFIAAWYRHGRKDLAREVDTRQPGMGKSDRPGDAFELALANACGALGYGVLFAGSILQSAGVDLIAFDGLSRNAYAISATTGNDLMAKLRTWVDTEPIIAADLEPEWTLRPVIITTQPTASLIQEDLDACTRRRVLVLAAENLAPLRESPPDLQTFSKLLAEPAPDFAQLQRARAYGIGTMLRGGPPI